MRRCSEKSPLAGGDVCRLPKGHDGPHAGYLRQWDSRPAVPPAEVPDVLEGQTSIEDVL
jgi:hypothetical protein